MRQTGDHLWKASPGCSPLHCASGGPVLHQQASPCPPTSCARDRGPWSLDCRSTQEEHCPGASGDRKGRRRGPWGKFLLTWPGERQNLAPRERHPRQKRTWDPDFLVSARVPGKGGK